MVWRRFMGKDQQFHVSGFKMTGVRSEFNRIFLAIPFFSPSRQNFSLLDNCQERSTCGCVMHGCASHELRFGGGRALAYSVQVKARRFVL